MTTFEATVAGLEKLGFTMDKVEGTLAMATFITDSGKIQLMVGYPHNETTKVTGVVNKPNGAVKWLYNKTSAQFCRAVAQVVEHWNR